jgi:hypothetical protein
VVLYCTVLYCTVLYCTVLYCTVLYCTVKGNWQLELGARLHVCSVQYNNGSSDCFVPVLIQDNIFLYNSNTSVIIFKCYMLYGGLVRFGVTL